LYLTVGEVTINEQHLLNQLLIQQQSNEDKETTSLQFNTLEYQGKLQDSMFSAAQ
jgi:hypothetical protein